MEIGKGIGNENGKEDKEDMKQKPPGKGFKQGLPVYTGYCTELS